MMIEPWTLFWMIITIIVAWECRGLIALIAIFVCGGIFLGLSFLLLMCGAIGIDTYNKIKNWIKRRK